MDALDRVIRARELLNDVTPLRSDCGRICGRACCRSDENGKGGMLLFPGEEKLYGGDGEFQVRPDDTVTADGLIVTCSGRCERDRRPLACRFFPMRPAASGRAVMDRRSAWVCPLYEGGRDGLRAEFVSAAEEAARILAEDPSLARFMEALRERIRFETSEEQLWG